MLMLIIVQWLHVILGIFWFGTSLFTNFILIPATSKLPLDQQRAANKAIGEYGHKIMLVVPLLVILMGILRGTIWGSVQALDVLFETTYGITFLIAMLASIVTYSWGVFVMGPAIHTLNAIPLEKMISANGTMTPE